MYNDESRFYINDNHCLVEVIEWQANKVMIRNHTKRETKKFDKVMWVILANDFTVVKNEDLELAKLLYC